MPKTFDLNHFEDSLEHSACGVVMRVDLDDSHELVLDALHRLSQVEYRSGYNSITGESDGAGIRFFGLPVKFFQRKIANQAFEKLELKDFNPAQFAVGQYFLPNQESELFKAKQLITKVLHSHGLDVLGWRDLNDDLDLSILSETVLKKKPGIWQAIIQSRDLPSEHFEHQVLTAALEISHQSTQQNITINILSQSSESIVYKGMIRPKELGVFFKDLQQTDFTARAFINHARFATNTDPQWANAQPCVFFWAHNGELNSAKANALQMRDELDLNAEIFKGIYPDAKLSDSMQFDADMANQVAFQKISMLEAFTRLMPPNLKDVECPHQKAMLQAFMLNRTPYNGPAFAVSGYQGYFVAKLDSVGLRPSRWALMQDSNGRPQFFAASDDLIEPVIGQKLLAKGHLSPGAMLVFTPQGELLDTKKALELVESAYPADYFSKKLASELMSLEDADALSTFDYQGSMLNRILYSSGWDYECVEHVVRYMAEHGMEKVAAMGDDTNPLYANYMPGHIAYFFHQLFAQVSAPPLDSTHESENFSLSTQLGPVEGKKLTLSSPMLALSQLEILETQKHVAVFLIDTCFPVEKKDGLNAMVQHLELCLRQSEEAAKNGGILIISDRAIAPNKISIPDLIMVAAVRRHLQNQKLIRQVSIVIDTYQVHGPHHASCLLALGANAVYPRGSYAKIADLFDQEHIKIKAKNYQHALDKCLLKTMGKMGITDVNNYINGHLIAALGLDLSSEASLSLLENPCLSNIFSGIYSPMKGIGLNHVARAMIVRHQQAYALDNDFIMMPYSGYFMPEKNGIKHGYGPVVINAFTAWLKTEEVYGVLARMHGILASKGYTNFVENEQIFSATQGFLNPLMKDAGGYYPDEYLEELQASAAFRKMIAELDGYRILHPTCIRDYFKFKESAFQSGVSVSVQSKKEIRSKLFAGSLSQGALTVTDANSSKLGAHETLTRGMNAIGANSASGEGGESFEDLRNPLHSTKSKQIASGRFGVNAAQIMHAQEMEIKIAQGAKPGEGGQLPGSKVSIRFAAQRGGLPGTPFISPPPHHDIYSIEDLEQLIFDIKTVNPRVKVAVKLVASQGIGTIAVGVAKAGADVINIASHSGGTGAAQQSSIKHTGLPAELGLAEVDYALRLAKLRDLVELRVSGGLKTADDVIISAILGADLFELGTTAMLTLGCKMQRTCNQSCQPGVATDGHLFKGNQLNVERYFVNLAALIQERLHNLGVASLKELRGRTELLELADESILKLYDFSAILDRTQYPQLLSAQQLMVLKETRLSSLARDKQDQLITDIVEFFDKNAGGIYQSPVIELNNQDRSFGARVSGYFVKFLEANPQAKIILQTHGNAGQSFCFVLPKGMSVVHQGFVQDGCAKSMCGGELIIKTPQIHEHYHADKNSIAGNVMLYGASSGKAFINGVVGHRFAILCKGAEIVVEGAGDFAFEYMTSGTGLIIGSYGHGIGASSSGGIIFAYDPVSENPTFSDAVRMATSEEAKAYESVILTMLHEHIAKTGSMKASKILEQFDIEHFKVLIPKALDKIQTLSGVLSAIKTFLRPEANLSCGMRIWLEQKTLQLVVNASGSTQEQAELLEILSDPKVRLFSKAIDEQLVVILQGQKPLSRIADIEDLVKPSRNQQIKQATPIEQRLSGIRGQLDEIFYNAIMSIEAYASELSVDAQGCSGCRAQSCAGGDGVDTGCPSGKQINTINAILQRLGQIKDGTLNKHQWQILREAFEVQIKESPFIAYTGAACPAPCQDACTESIPDKLGMKGSKAIGEPVHIKDIEYHLYHLGRAMGWFNGQKQFTQEEQLALFGSRSMAFQQYLNVIKSFKPVFTPSERKIAGKKLVVVGSGPAAMQIAFEGLRDGYAVEMYERSDKPGGLLFDGIPAHKFDKSFILEDFINLQMMGLSLYLNHEVHYDESKQGFYSSGRCIAQANDERVHVVLCLGAGKPVTLAPDIMPHVHHDKIIQAVDLLKAKNDIAESLRLDPLQDKEVLIAEKLGKMDTRGKKVVVVGGGDTAQDVIRWVARYFNDEKQESKGQLNILVRGLAVTERGILDAYPAASKAPSKENILKDMEVEFVSGDTHHSVYPTKIDADEVTGQLTVHLAKVNYRYQNQIEDSSDLTRLDSLLPRELKPKEKPEAKAPIENVDMVILAMGFQGRNSIALANHVEESGLTNVSFAGDVAGTKAKIIVGAQASAHETYQNRIRPMLGYSQNHTAQGFFASSHMMPSASQLNHINIKRPM